MVADRVAVLLMAYGGPDNLAEVEPYLLDVRGGRPTSPELVEEIRGRYVKIGGRSPPRRLTGAQAAGPGPALRPRCTPHGRTGRWPPPIKGTAGRTRGA